MPILHQLDIRGLGRALGLKAESVEAELLQDGIRLVFDISDFLIRDPSETEPIYARTFQGQIVRRTLTVPAAGADWTWIIPDGMAWRWRSIRTRFTAAAGGGVRLPRLTIQDPTGIEVALLPGTATASAGQQVEITWGDMPYIQSSLGLLEFGQTIPFTPLLPPGWRIQVFTANLAALDQWNFIHAMIEQFRVD